MRRARFTTLAALSAAAVVLAGCSSGDTAPTSDPSQPPAALAEKTKIVVGTLAIVDTAPIYLGIEQGFFDDENLEVQTEVAAGGAALLPAVVSGDYQFGFSEMASLLVAASKGLPLQVVSVGVSSNGNTAPGEDFNEVLVAPDSSIENVRDLEGKKVATNSLTNINYVLVRDAVDAAGGNSDEIQFVEIPFPDQVNALLTGQVDAIATPEPFHTIALNQGAVPIYQTYSATSDMTVSAWFTSSQFAATDPDVVAAFQRAIQRSLEYATANPDAARESLLTYTQLDPELVEQIVLPGWPGTLDRASLEYVLDASGRYGLIENDVDIDALLGSTPVG